MVNDPCNKNLIIINHGFSHTKISAMCKIKNLQRLTTNCALDSDCQMMVGAMIVRGSRVYSTGFNNKRTTFLNMRDCSQHAEMAAASHFINTVVKKNPKKYCFVREE